MSLHPSQLLFMGCLGFVGGILAESVLTIPEWMVFGILAFGGALFVLSVSRKACLAYACIVVAAAFGMARSGDAEHAWQQQRAEFLSLASRHLSVRATVVSRENLASAKRYVLEDIVPEHAGEVKRNMRLQFLDASANVFSPGDALIIRGARFDISDEFTSFLKRDGVAGALTFPKEIVFEENRCANRRRSASCFSYALNAALIYARDAFERSLTKVLPEPHAALAQGLLLGARTALPADIKESFRYLGLSHIVAVSGYNITIVVLAVSTMLGFFMVSRRTSFWIASVFLLLFTLLTGSSASVVRAASMGFLIILAQHASRMYSARVAIALAGALMLFQNPFLLRHDVGFLLSFLATVGLLTLYPLLEERAEHLPKLGPIKDVLLQSLSAQAFVLPVLIVAFGSIPFLFLVSNALILPFIPPTMLFGFFGGVAGIFGGTLGGIVAFPAYVLLAWELGIVELLARIPHAQALIVSPSLRWIFGIGAGVFVCWLTGKLHRHKYANVEKNVVRSAYKQNA